MNIMKYKKMANGRYKLFLGDGTDLLLYEDTILKFELLLKKEIINNIMDDVIEFNNYCDVYYTALKSLKTRFKSTKELKEFLIKKEYNINYIVQSIDKLLSQGYLNDDSFTKGFINNQIITTNKGPYKISRELVNKGVSNEIINNNLDIFNDELQVDKINKLIKKLIKVNRTRGGMVLKRKISNDLVNLGYSASLINAELNNYNLTETQDIYKREYDKLYRRLSRKYTGKELEYKIREKMYQKGLVNNNESA